MHTIQENVNCWKQIKCQLNDKRKALLKMLKCKMNCTENLKGQMYCSALLRNLEAEKPQQTSSKPDSELHYLKK